MRINQFINVIAITIVASLIGCDEGTPVEDSIPPTTGNSVPVTPDDSLSNTEDELPPTADENPFVDDNNNGGEGSPEGDLPEPDPGYPTDVVVNVQYEGAAVGNLLVTLFDSWPPMGPPPIFSDWPNVNFPTMATLLDVPAGTWKLVVVLDVEPFNPAVQGPEDLMAMVDIVVPTEGTVMVTLEDGIPENPDENVDDENPDDWSTPVEEPEDVVGNPEPEEEPTNDGLFVSNGDPFEMGPLDVDMQNITQGTGGAPTDLLVFSPSAPGTYAVVMFHHGFLIANQFYSEILTHIASHGFVVVAPQTYPPGGLPFGQPTTDEEAVTILSVLTWAQTGLADLLTIGVNTEQMALAGHARGAKLSWIVAQSQPELVMAVAAVDPVNGDGGGFATNEASALDQPLPVGMPSLVIGSGLSDVGLDLFSPACTPVGENHVQFFELSGSPSWYMLATDAGHLDFLDASTPGCGLECTACTSGALPEVTRQHSAGSLAAFFRGYLQGDDEAIDSLDDSGAYPASWVLESK